MKVEIRDSIVKDIKRVSRKEKEKLQKIYDTFLKSQNITDIQGVKN